MQAGQAVDLSFAEAGQGELVIILHGFLGAGRHWQSIGRRLGQTHRALWADLRNHGGSPWSSDMTYAAMAADIVALIDRCGVARAHLIGHSMGGKVAMMTALLYPERVASCMAVDIAPVAYRHSFDHIFHAMRAVPLATLNRRKQVEDALAEELDDPGLRAFIMQNLNTQTDELSWRCNLAVLEAEMPEITGWRAPPSIAPYQSGPVSLLRGGRSDYVSSSGIEAMQSWFPKVEVETIENAGHWVHADAPEEAFAAITRHLAKA